MDNKRSKFFYYSACKMRSMLLFLILFFCVAHAFAATENDEKIRTYLTGDWYGARQQLASHGISWHGNYVINAAANIGGRQNGSSQASSIGSDLTIDFSQLCDLPGWSFFISGAFRFGTSLSSKKIGNAFSVQQVFGSQTIRLVDLYLAYSKEKAFYLKFGRINTGEDFQVSRLFAEFMNNSFNGNPITPNFNFLFSVFPVSTWGMYTEIFPADWFRIKSGIYNNNREIFVNDTHGTYFSFTPSLGALLYTEWGLLLQHSKDLKGTYLVGSGYSTGKTNHQLKETVRGNYQLYVQLEESLIWKDPHEKEIAPFFTFLYFPEDRNPFPYFFMGGVVTKGLFRLRPEDRISWGTSWGFYSKELDTKQTFEGCMEWNYKLQISPYFYIEPNLQYVIRPSGDKNLSNAWVFGLQSECLF